jgi:TPR repeat protein
VEAISRLARENEPQPSVRSRLAAVAGHAEVAYQVTEAVPHAAADQGRRWTVPSVSRNTLVYFGALASIALVLGGVYLHSQESTGSQTEASVDATRAETLFSQAESLYFGRSGPRDFGKALTLYSEAAKLGYAPAENAVGRMFQYGEGVAPSSAEAIRWYSLAAQQGHPDAAAALSRLTRPQQTPQLQVPPNDSTRPPPSPTE